MSPHQNHPPAWLHGHAHDPNPTPPSPDASFVVRKPNGVTRTIDVADLQALPAIAVPDCYVISTGHGTSGPFTFRGVRLSDLLNDVLAPDIHWRYADVISADGFGTRVFAHEVQTPATTRPILLSDAIDGTPMTRAQGLVRLIVPSETDDALRQVKWVRRIDVY